MTANPIDVAVIDGVNVVKANLRSYEKTRVRMRMADANEVRSTSLSGQFAGIYVRSLQHSFDLDAADVTTADDGINCIVDFDGNRFKRVAVVPSKTQREVNAAGDVTIAADDADEIIIAKTVAAATRVTMPLSTARPPGRSIRIADGKFDAATNNITVVPSRPDTVTISLASPGVVTKTAHGWAADQPVSLETTGALYTGLAADTQYYVKTVLTPDTFTIADTPGGAAINTSGSQSGTHKIGTDTIMGRAKYVIDSDGASIELSPRASGVKGWF